MAKLKPTYAFLKRLEFLSSGQVYLKKAVKIITFSYDTGKPRSAGLRKFIREKLPPIQYKNPEVQVVLFKNKHPFPAVWVYFEDGKKAMLAVEGKTPEKILAELSSLAAKTESQVKEALKKAEYNPALFGDARRGRLCICEVPGQVQCPKYVPIENIEHAWKNKSDSS